MADTSPNLRTLFEDLEHDAEYQAECAIVEFTENIARRMDELGISRSELARRLDTSPAYVTKILRGNANFTLKSMARISLALDSALTTHLQPEGAHSQWFDRFQACNETMARPPATANIAKEMRHYRPVAVHSQPEDSTHDPVASAA